MEALPKSELIPKEELERIEKQAKEYAAQFSPEFTLVLYQGYSEGTKAEFLAAQKREAELRELLAEIMTIAGHHVGRRIQESVEEKLKNHKL